MRTRKTAGVERHRNSVRETLTDVVDRDEQREELTLPDDRWRGERHVEVRIADENAALT